MTLHKIKASQNQRNLAVRRLGPRLEHLYQWAIDSAPYDHVWDLCCDHARLGLHLFQAEALSTAKIHLVDCVPSIIKKLERQYLSCVGAGLSIECADARTVRLPNEGRQLIIIAGVGGSTLVDILSAIIENLNSLCPTTNIDIEFLLSANSNMFDVRRSIKAHALELIKEEFVTEKSWHHEHLHLGYNKGLKDSSSNISSVGDRLWSPFTEAKHNHIQKLITHYEKRSRLGNQVEASRAAVSYHALLKKLM